MRDKNMNLMIGSSRFLPLSRLKFFTRRFKG